ncbi:MAG: hypothetical protein FWG69_02810 [Oscillospiraceae bacterium]|nr:hypothetical protein [Oscillospiraceae bacterium]
MENKNWIKLAVSSIKTIILAKLMCLFLFIAVLIFFEHLAVRITVQILMTFIYLALPYSSMRKEGAHDRNFVNLGRIAEDLYKPAKAGLALVSPYMLSWILLIVFQITGFFPAYYGIFKLVNIQYLPFYLMIESSPVLSENSIFTMIIMLLPSILLPVISFFGYYFGYKDIWPGQKLLYRKKSG